MKFILPASPFVLFQLKVFEIDYSLILVLLILVTALALYINAHNNRKIDKNTAIKNPALLFIINAPFKLKISMDS